MNSIKVKKIQPPSCVENIKAYPNPATNIIYIQTSGKAVFILTSSNGKIILTKTISNKGEINVSGFANGIYYIQNKTTGETKKIIVAH